METANDLHITQLKFAIPEKLNSSRAIWTLEGREKLKAISIAGNFSLKFEQPKK